MSVSYRILGICLFIIFAISNSSLVAQPILNQDFESGWGSWWASNGIWDVGIPTVGPANAHSGQNCAGTDLYANYPANMNTGLISPQIILPAGHIRLKFWHWYSFYYLSNYGDCGKVLISTDGINWTTLTIPNYDNRSEVWTQACVDLSNYAGQTVRIGFYAYSDNNPTTTGAGWYIDDVSIVAGEEYFPNPEDFESGVGDWGSDNGLWQVGVPTVGPSNPHSGQSCAGTVLGGNYFSEANSRFITPLITLPSGHIRLKFWHWYSFYYLGTGDYGQVQISTDGINWITLTNPNFDNRSEVWSQTCVDLSNYASQTVRICFYFHSDNNPTTTGAGWYIDDVSIVEGEEYFPNPEDFESGIGDWGSDNGLWQVGVPTVGPSSPHSGLSCAGTVLDGDYFSEANTRLVSPSILLTPLSGQTPELFFWHWYIMGDGDQGQVQISVNNGPWQNIPGFGGPYNGTNNVWSQSYVPLSAFVDSTIRIGFLFTSNNNPTTVGNGWYIDDVRIEGIPTDIGENQNIRPYRYSLMQNYPNPFNPITNIHFGLPKASQVKVEIFNTLGQRVATLLDGDKPAGYHTIQFDGRKLSSGLYFYKIEAGNLSRGSGQTFSQVRKMLLVK